MTPARIAALAGITALLVALAAWYFVSQRGTLVAAAPAGKAAEPKAAPAQPAAGAAPGKGPGGPGGPTAVEAIVVKPVPVQETLQAVGSLRSNESVVLKPEVAGRIATIGFRDGQAVRKGQLLVGLDATLNEAEVAKAQAEWDLALSNLKRTEDLARQNFVSGSARETAASNAQVLEANVKLAQARLAKMRIVAPFDGVAGIRSVSVGDYVKDGAELVNLEDIGTLKVDFRLPERSFARTRVGQPVRIVADALPAERFEGVIEAINPRIDANGRSLEVRARLANPAGRLRPGMFVRVTVIVGERADALLVPEEAIVPLGEDFHVYRVVGDQARRVKVTLGVRRDGQVEILDGIAAGDRIVTAGMRLARDGQTVRLVEAGAAQGKRESAP